MAKPACPWDLRWIVALPVGACCAFGINITSSSRVRDVAGSGLQRWPCLSPDFDWAVVRICGTLDEGHICGSNQKYRTIDTGPQRPGDNGRRRLDMLAGAGSGWLEHLVQMGHLTIQQPCSKKVGRRGWADLYYASGHPQFLLPGLSEVAARELKKELPGPYEGYTCS